MKVLLPLIAGILLGVVVTLSVLSHNRQTLLVPDPLVAVNIPKDVPFEPSRVIPMNDYVNSMKHPESIQGVLSPLIFLSFETLAGGKSDNDFYTEANIPNVDEMRTMRSRRMSSKWVPESVNDEETYTSSSGSEGKLPHHDHQSHHNHRHRISATSLILPSLFMYYF